MWMIRSTSLCKCICWYFIFFPQWSRTNTHNVTQPHMYAIRSVQRQPIPIASNPSDPFNGNVLVLFFLLQRSVLPVCVYIRYDFDIATLYTTYPRCFCCCCLIHWEARRSWLHIGSIETVSWYQTIWEIGSSLQPLSKFR